MDTTAKVGGILFKLVAMDSSILIDLSIWQGTGSIGRDRPTLRRLQRWHLSSTARQSTASSLELSWIRTRMSSWRWRAQAIDTQTD